MYHVTLTVLIISQPNMTDTGGFCCIYQHLLCVCVYVYMY